MKHWLGTKANDSSSTSLSAQIEYPTSDDRARLWKTKTVLVLGTSLSARISRVLRSTPIQEQFMNKLLGQPGSISNSNRYRQDDVVQNTLPTEIVMCVVQSMRKLLSGMLECGLHVETENDGHRETVLASVAIEESWPNGELVRALAALSTDSNVVLAQSAPSSPCLDVVDEHSKYFLDEVDRIVSSTYTVTQEDVRHFHAKYEGIVDVTFPYRRGVLRVVDPRQRMEMKKLSPFFTHVDAIVFLASLAEYDEMTTGGSPNTKLMESVQLFDAVCRSPYFGYTLIILVLTDIDAFRKKLSKTPLRDSFDDFTGGTDYDSACDYIRHRFVSLGPQSSIGSIHPHFIRQFDDGRVKLMLSDIQDLIIARSQMAPRL